MKTAISGVNPDWPTWGAVTVIRSAANLEDAKVGIARECNRACIAKEEKPPWAPRN